MVEQIGLAQDGPKAEPTSSPEDETQLYVQELERRMMSLVSSASVSGQPAVSPLTAFVSLLAQDISARLANLKQTQAEVQAALAAEKDGMLRMLEEDRRNKAATGLTASPEALTASVATVSVVSMLQQLDSAITGELKALASWLVQIEGMGILATVEAASNVDGSEIPSLAAQVLPGPGGAPPAMARLEAALGCVDKNSDIVRHAAATFVSCCACLAGGRHQPGSGAGVLPSEPMAAAAIALAGESAHGVDASALGQGQGGQFYTTEELRLLLSCMDTT